MLGCLRYQIVCPSIVIFTVATSILSAVVLNWRFWHDVVLAVRPTSNFEVLFVSSMFAVMVLIHATLLLLVPRGRPVKAVAATVFILGAITAYFVDSLGISFDSAVIRSLVETDRQEASALMTWRFVFYLLFAGILPAVAIFRVQLPTEDFGVRRRVAFIGVALAGSAFLIIALLSVYAPFWRANKMIAHRINPDAALVASINYLAEHLKWSSPFGPMTNPGVPTRTIFGHGPKPVLLFLNIGETARAANFQLGGYGRGTNPELSAEGGVLYFNNATSCGTVTAVSVPCLFSHGGRRIFSLITEGRQTNLLDAVASGGYRVEWRENNSGTKGVPERMRTITYAPGSNPTLCVNGPCFDEIMTSGLADELRRNPQNTLIVFHQMGSHGPSYWQRYPERFERFKPSCQIKELWRCSQEELVNVYDNTILYTDHVLAEQIRLMRGLSDQFDSIMIYVSDHGESLGERGLYLHGAPFFFAPKEQTHIPLLMWLSSGYRDRLGMDEPCLRAQRDSAISHDNIYHTVLGALGLRNDVYKTELDLITTCAIRVRPAS